MQYYTMSKYYYLDENNQKVYYAGKIINDCSKNELYGVLTKFKEITKKIKLEHQPAEEATNGWSSYFTYKDTNDNTQIYKGNKFNIRKSFDGSYFITKTEKVEIPVKYYPEIKTVDEYFTYIDENKEEVKYEGNKKPSYDKETNTYFIYK